MTLSSYTPAVVFSSHASEIPYLHVFEVCLTDTAGARYPQVRLGAQAHELCRTDAGLCGARSCLSALGKHPGSCFNLREEHSKDKAKKSHW